MLCIVENVAHLWGMMPCSVPDAGRKVKLWKSRLSLHENGKLPHFWE